MALPDENRPSWRPQDENARNRRSLSEEDDRYDDDRYMRSHWDDRDRRDYEMHFQSRNQGYPGSFEDRYRDRYSNFSPRGYGYDDGDRVRDRDRMVHSERGMDRRAQSPSGHRGKGPSGYHRSDERIREMACEALTEDDRVDATNIEIHVRDAEVTLTGHVDDRQQKRLAEDCVDNVMGVKDVHNQLKVGSKR